VSVVSDKADRTYPYFGLRECGHIEICHDSLECGELNEVAATLEKIAHKVVKSSFQAKEQVRVS